MIVSAPYIFPERDNIFFENTDTSLAVCFCSTEIAICEKERENYTVKRVTVC
jgi:hypothetical protein